MNKVCNVVFKYLMCVIILFNQKIRNLEKLLVYCNYINKQTKQYKLWILQI
jgi:hypothetical protein